MANRTRRTMMRLRPRKFSPNPMQIQRAKKVISSYQIPEKKEKEEKSSKWQYKQVLNVWSPIFTKKMFGMANLRSALFRVPFLQFSLCALGTCAVRSYRPVSAQCIRLSVKAQKAEKCFSEVFVQPKRYSEQKLYHFVLAWKGESPKFVNSGQKRNYA